MGNRSRSEGIPDCSVINPRPEGYGSRLVINPRHEGLR